MDAPLLLERLEALEAEIDAHGGHPGFPTDAVRALRAALSDSAGEGTGEGIDAALAALRGFAQHFPPRGGLDELLMNHPELIPRVEAVCDQLGIPRPVI